MTEDTVAIYIYIYIYEELETMRIVSHDHIAQLPETIEGPLAVGFIILYC